MSRCSLGHTIPAVNSGSEAFARDSNPLLSDDPDAWGRLIDAVGPAAMLVRIENRMSASLRRRLTPEDLWQETMLHAWRDRHRCQWNGLKGFRSWLVQIAENRIRDAADHEGAEKRGAPIVLSVLMQSDSQGCTGSHFVEPASSTTPSRLAIHSEEAQAMRHALDSLPDSLRDVVRMRIFEEQGLESIGGALGLSHAVVKHRLRQGAEQYRRRLSSALASHLRDSDAKT